jgi:hypothetical protein
MFYDPWSSKTEIQSQDKKSTAQKYDIHFSMGDDLTIEYQNEILPYAKQFVPLCPSILENVPSIEKLLLAYWSTKKKIGNMKCLVGQKKYKKKYR